MKAKDLLVESGALRQYRRNDNSGFVPGYDCEETERVVNSLLADIEQKRQPLDHRRILRVVDDYAASIDGNGLSGLDDQEIKYLIGMIRVIEREHGIGV